MRGHRVVIHCPRCRKDRVRLLQPGEPLPKFRVCLPCRTKGQQQRAQVQALIAEEIQHLRDEHAALQRAHDRALTLLATYWRTIQNFSQPAIPPAPVPR